MKTGILGGGQLARMLALAGVPLGARFSFVDPSENACACDVGRLIVGEWDDRDTLMPRHMPFASELDTLLLKVTVHGSRDEPKVSRGHVAGRPCLSEVSCD